MIKLSIIVPFFNEESHLERCLRSLEQQDIPMTDFEIICINDGSIDNSRDVVIRLKNEFDNISLIDQKNQGVSLARNNGIDNARGSYVMFIDADDYVESNCFGRLLENAFKQKAQVSILGFTIFYESGKKMHEVSYKDLPSKIYPGIKAYFEVRRNGHIVPDRILGILFDRDFINMNNLRYLPNVPYLEDGELIARILCLAECCIFDGNSILKGTYREGSASSSKNFYSEKAINGFLLSASNLKRFQYEQNLSESQRIFLNQPICKFVLLTLNSSLQKPYVKNYRRIRKLLISNDFKRIELKGVDESYNYYVHIYNNFMVGFLLSALLKEYKQNIKVYFRKF